LANSSPRQKKAYGYLQNQAVNFPYGDAKQFCPKIGFIDIASFPQTFGLQQFIRLLNNNMKK
jgi:hypothetical protein